MPRALFFFIKGAPMRLEILAIASSARSISAGGLLFDLYNPGDYGIHTDRTSILG